MEINDAMVQKLARLSKLSCDGERLNEMKADLGRMIDFIDKLNELDTDEVAPLIHMTEETNVLRNDEVKHQVSQEAALKNGPDTNSDYFRVPKVLKG